MAKKELVWKDIKSPGGDADLFVLEGRKYRIAESLKEDQGYGECKRLCRVSDLDSSGKDEFAVISAFIRTENGAFVRGRAILSKPVSDIGSAIEMFESTR
ncbi:MAG: hypothetical protein M1125_00490 [Candidatus Marsarchaeota archaeon]|nr:hypothetical protein [Candidatus Marsarchaeota archaeon]